MNQQLHLQIHSIHVGSKLQELHRSTPSVRRPSSNMTWLLVASHGEWLCFLLMGSSSKNVIVMASLREHQHHNPSRHITSHQIQSRWNNPTSHHGITSHCITSPLHHITPPTSCTSISSLRTTRARSPNLDTHQNHKIVETAFGCRAFAFQHQGPQGQISQFG